VKQNVSSGTKTTLPTVWPEKGWAIMPGPISTGLVQGHHGYGAESGSHWSAGGWTGRVTLVRYRSGNARRTAMRRTTFPGGGPSCTESLAFVASPHA
jgi:hypothetical protein